MGTGGGCVGAAAPEDAGTVLRPGSAPCAAVRLLASGAVRAAFDRLGSAFECATGYRLAIL